jgi:catechol 2,3-dioxygenase-like lactoylglutathione lyase family enzyme
MVEKISAITFRILNMKASVRFYRNVLGLELLYGGEQASFSSLRANDSESAILNLEQGDTVSRWGRLIFHVTDVDAFWTHLKERGFNPEIPRDASWGERYFHMLDPDGHELSFAHPLPCVRQKETGQCVQTKCLRRASRDCPWIRNFLFADNRSEWS